MSEAPEIGDPDFSNGNKGRPQGSPVFALWRLLRPTQWIKNTLLFAALVFAQRLFDFEAVLLATLGFSSFSLASSSVYVINDLIDADRDRAHPVKRFRPIASGEVNNRLAGLLAVLLTLSSMGLAFWIGPEFGWSVLIYLAMSHFYSMMGKGIAILDVMLIAAGFVIRAVSGALAIEVPISSWFLLCALFLSLFIALCKRKAELLALDTEAAQTRPVLRIYTLDALNTFVATSMSGTLISYALYVLDSRHTTALGINPLSLTLPFVLFGVFRYALLVETAGSGERAEEVLLRDHSMGVCVLAFAAVAVWALYGGGS
ncbi:decaprenyl-phosphate phosphoribosyltransferase [Myxococcota bacterium]|nr:decaprenyl-phosphate phosphoribosyltransferase [Myxococcota bacterium]